MQKRRLASIILPVTFVTAIAAGALPAQAALNAPATRNSACSLGSVSNIQVQREDNGTLSIDFAVDMSTHRSGVSWTYRVVDNRTLVMKGTASTATDGSFSTTRGIGPSAGVNHIVALARNSSTGETCRIRVLL